MKKKVKQREELEQYQAYGEYSYAYRHAADEQDSAYPPEEYENAPLPPEYAEEPPEQEPYLTPEEARLAAIERAKSRSRAITGRLILMLGIVVAVLAILQGAVFKLTTVYVVGNKNLTAQEIAAASGLVKGLNMFSISEEDVRRNLSSNHNIVFLGLRKEFPNTVYLLISEREAVAATQWLGLLYTLDAEAVVMDERNTLDLPGNMPSVTGLQVTNIHVGQALEVRNREQLQAYFDIIGELNQQYYLDQIVEMNLSDANDLYLLTAAGISVRLGDRTHMRAKIGALRTDMAYLQQLGKNTGILDVTIPEDAKYRPDS